MAGTWGPEQFTGDPPKWFAHEVSLRFQKMLPGSAAKGGPNDTVTHTCLIPWSIVPLFDRSFVLPLNIQNRLMIFIEFLLFE